MSQHCDDLMTFLNESSSPFHAVSALAARLQKAGFTQIKQLDDVVLSPGSGYFVTANDSSIIAFRAGHGQPTDGLRIIGAHTDSPNLSVKPNPVKKRSGVV